MEETESIKELVEIRDLLGENQNTSKDSLELAVQSLEFQRKSLALQQAAFEQQTKAVTKQFEISRIYKIVLVVVAICMAFVFYVLFKHLI